LNPEAEKLVRAGREALRPSDADRERVFLALQPRLGGDLGGGTAGAESAVGTSWATLLKISAALVGLGLAGGGLFLAQRPEPPPPSTVVPAPVKAAPVPAPPSDPVKESAAPAAPPAEPATKRSPVPSRSADNLAREVAILSRASSELRAGRPAAALKALDEHQREFPSGVLSQERTAARIQALCALGRMNEAKSELAKLARTSPQSPHAARARKACGFGSTDKE
jgi:TolA-binding protein